MADYEMYIESSVRGYHAYFKDASVCVGEILMCEVEEDSSHDRNAVAIKNEAGYLVGHVPTELPKVFNKLLRDYGEFQAICIGNRYNAGYGKGFEFPVDYKLIGNEEYLRNWKTKNLLRN